MQQNPQNFTYAPPYAVQTQPYSAWQVPPWADPQKREQKEMRKAASRLSWAVLASLPLGTIISAALGVVLSVCGANLLLDPGEGVNGIPGVAYYLLSALMSFFTLVLPFALFLLIGNRRLEDSVLVEKVGFFQGLLLALAGLFLCIIMNIPANIISTLLEELGLNGASNTSNMSVDSLADVLTLILSVVLVAPITEEFAFRGVTVAVMRRWGDWTAVIFSALLFAFAHYSFQGMPVVLAGGFVMALLYIWTRNIWVTIFVHFLNNLVASLPLIVEFYAGEQAKTAVTNISMLAVCVLGVLAIILLSVRHFTGRCELSFRMQRGVPIRGKIKSMFLNVGFIVYFVVFIIMAVVSLYAV